MNTMTCTCASTPPTYPVFRDEPHLPGCAEGERLALEVENQAAIEDAMQYALEANQEMENAAAWRRRAERWKMLAGYYRRWAHAEYVGRTGDSLPSTTADVYATDRCARRRAEVRTGLTEPGGVVR